MYDTVFMFVVLVICVEGIQTQALGDSRLVHIGQGPVRGHLDPEGGVYSFYNIPYGTAPTGPNRFQAPTNPPEWFTTFDAVDRHIVCPQAGIFLNIQEDCLVANVFTPDTNLNNLPVVISVHGGAYHKGFGNSMKFNALVRTKKLIVVTFNYRLGPHGFLCLGTKSAPGNAGLKDQVALLRWVNANIASFGGNPKDVTLMGCSAGAGSVDLLTLSKLTAGLFTKAIVGSGSSFGTVGVQIDPIANAQKYATLLNFTDVYNLDALEEFYTMTSYEQLLSKSNEISNCYDSHLLFGPCIERDVGEEMLLEDSPINIVKQGKYHKVPLLYGFVDMEGLMRLPNFELWKGKMNKNFAEFLPGELYFENEETRQQVAKTVKEFYFGSKPISTGAVLDYINYFTDTMFSYTMLKELSARVESLNDTIYLYEYSFTDVGHLVLSSTEVRGAAHCDQSRAITDQDTNAINAEYSKMKSIMREYWLNFILTGTPWINGSELVPWPPANANRSPHLSLGRIVQVKKSLLEHRAAFWDSIYEKHYRAPRSPGGL